MARLASQEKMEYYPTPEKAVERSLQKIKATVPVRALDPCAGDGRTLKIIKEKINDAAVYGIELDSVRSAQVSEITGKENCLSETDALLDARITAGSFNLIFNNPPYDWERGYGDKRLEHSFIERYSPVLVEGGIMILVIGKSLFESYYRMEELLKIIFKNFAVIDFFEMTEDTQFGQYVVFLRKAKLLPLISILKVLGSNDELDRKLEHRLNKYEFFESWNAVIEMSQILRPKTDHNDFSLTVEPKPLKLFKSVAITEEMFNKALALNNKVIDISLEEIKPMDTIETLLPLRNSHLPLLLPTGHLNGKIDGTNLVINGQVERFTEIYEEVEVKADKNGKEKEVAVAKEINKFRAKLSVLNLKTKEVIAIN